MTEARPGVYTKPAILAISWSKQNTQRTHVCNWPRLHPARTCRLVLHPGRLSGPTPGLFRTYTHIFRHCLQPCKTITKADFYSTSSLFQPPFFFFYKFERRIKQINTSPGQGSIRALLCGSVEHPAAGMCWRRQMQRADGSAVVAHVQTSREAEV